MQFMFQSFTRRKRYAVFILVILFALLAGFPLQQSQAQAQTSPKTKFPQDQLKRHEGSGFIMVRTPTGSECRPMTEAEARALPDVRKAELHNVSDPRLQLVQQGNLTIVLQGTPQLEGFAQAKAAFQRAAAKWQNAIKTPITVTLAVDFGTTFFGTPYNNPNIIGQTDVVYLVAQDTPSAPNQYRFWRDSVLDLPVDEHTRAFYNALPTAGLPTDVGVTRNAGGTIVNLRGLDIIDDETLAEEGPPSIGFNSALPFDFDASDGVDSDKLNFEATAIHEIGHALGFYSWVGFKELVPNSPIYPSTWDFFRFRNGPLDFSALAARPRAMMAGGTQFSFFGDELALLTATINGTNGDQRQGSHWRDDVLSGQFVGIMDPTGATGDREDISSTDLTTLGFMGYLINPDARVNDLQSIADPSQEELQERANATVVNRYLPLRYPSRLEGIRILMPAGSTGQSIRLIAFVDANRTGQPPASPSLLINQMVTVPNLPQNRYVEFRFATPPTINAGDVYLGMNVGASTVRFAADTTRPQGRSWLTTNDGANWTALPSLNNASSTANFMARAILSSTHGTTFAPQLLSLSPNTVAPATTNVTLFVNGRNFQRNSVIRFNGADRTTTYLSNTQLSAPLSAADLASAGTAPVRVFTPSGVESGALTFTIGANNPLPTITALDPSTGQSGASGVTINVYGTNFNAASRVRFNDQERTTTFRNGSQLEAALTAADLTSAATGTITVVNPAPGGGTSNLFGFPVSACNFGFATAAGTTTTGLIVTSAATSNGFTLNVGNGACGWNLTTSESWLSVTSPASGTGRTVINFAATENTGATPRTAQIRVNNQQSITIQQAGRVAAVSAASYANTRVLAPNSIVSVFGQGMATGVAAASTIPLPTRLGDTEATITFTRNDQLVTVNCPLFFVSPGQINLLIPGTVTFGTARLIVRLSGSLYADQVVTIAVIAPGLFAANANGQGVPAAQLLRVKPGGVLVYEDVAVFEGGHFVPRILDVGPDTDQLALILFGTGLRGVTAVDLVQIRIADQAPTTLFAGAQPDFTGLDQINLNLTAIRASLRGRGEVNLTGTIAGQTLNPLVLRFQ